MFAVARLISAAIFTHIKDFRAPMLRFNQVQRRLVLPPLAATSHVSALLPSIKKGWVMGGLAIDFDARFDADIYTSGDDLGEADTLSRATPASSITLRYPLAKNTDQATHILEPVLQISWADTLGDTPRNEDSTRSEFDEGNLLSFSRFSGQDAVETGFTHDGWLELLPYRKGWLALRT
jgi:hypothetical protein